MIFVDAKSVPPKQEQAVALHVYKDKPIVALEIPDGADPEPYQWCHIKSVNVNRPTHGRYAFDLEVVIRNEHETKSFDVALNALWADELKLDSQGEIQLALQRNGEWAARKGPMTEARTR